MFGMCRRNERSNRPWWVAPSGPTETPTITTTPTITQTPTPYTEDLFKGQVQTTEKGWQSIGFTDADFRQLVPRFLVVGVNLFFQVVQFVQAFLQLGLKRGADGLALNLDRRAAYTLQNRLHVFSR